jgi:ABC-type transport system involved in multi-copper enzyme maturation permease subunit
MLTWSNSRQAWAGRAAGAFALVSIAALAGFHQVLSGTQRLLLWILIGVALAVLLRRGWLRLVGPVLFHDAVRLARQGRHSAVRSLYATFLLVAFILGYVFWLAARPPSTQDSTFALALPATEIARFTAVFFFAFLAVQLAAVFLLTPPYLAGAIADEKERRTLELLLATDLHDREILFGLLFARMGNLALVLLAGLPVLSFLQFVGGGDPDLLLAGFLLAGLTMIGLAGLCMVFSLYARKPRQAIVRTYLVVVGYLVLSGLSWLLLIPRLGLASFPSTDDWVSPVTLTDVIVWLSAGNVLALVVELAFGVARGTPLNDMLPDAVQQYAWFQGMLFVGCAGWATVRLRRVALQEEGGSGWPGTRGRRARSGHKGLWLLSPPPVGNRPLVWKELFLESGAHRSLLGWLVSGMLVALLFWPVVQITYFYGGISPVTPPESLRDILSPWVRFLSLVLGCLMLLQVAVHAAGSISGERDRQTLEGLLTTPLSNHQILFSKWLGSILSPRGLALCLGAVWLIGLATHSLHWLAVPCFLACWLVLAAFLASLGLCFSIIKRTSLRATFWTILALGIMSVLTALACHDLPERWLSASEAWGLFPPLTLGLFAFPPWNLDDWLSGRLDYSLRGVPYWLAFWMTLASLLWWLTSYRFRTEFGRAPGSSTAELPSALNGTSALAAEGQKSGKPTGPPLPSLWPRRLVQVGVLFFPLGLLIGAYAMLHRAAESQLRGAIAEADRLDPGWRREEMQAKQKPLPDEQNSALQAQKVKRMLPKDFYGRDLIEAMQRPPVVPERQLTEYQVKLIGAELERCKAALAAAHPLIDMPEGRIRIEWEVDSNDDLSLDQGPRNAANLLGLEVLLLAQQGQADAALNTCRGVLNAGRALGDESVQRTALVRLGIQGLALDRIERCLAQGEPSEKVLSAMQQLLEDEGRQQLLLQAARGERAFVDEQMEVLQEGRRSPEATAGRRAQRPALVFSAGSNEFFGALSGSARTTRAEQLRLLTEAVESAKLPEWQQATAFTPLLRGMMTGPTPVRLGFLSLGRTAESWRYSLATLRSGIVALAVERYRQQHGRWPRTLAELVPAQLEKIPIDPFDGNPIRYGRFQGCVVVYSVSWDGVDNGGVFDRRAPRAVGTDVGLRLWDVEDRRQPPPPQPKTEGAAPGGAIMLGK